MIRVLLILTYSLASIVLGGMTGLYQGLSAGIFCGFIAFLFLLQMDGALLRRQDRKAHKSEIVSLKRSHAVMEKAVAETRAKMEEVTKAVEARATAQSKKIVSELQMLESLMREFAGKISGKAKAEPVEETMLEQRVPRRRRTISTGWANRSCWKPSAPRSKKTASISICSPSSACRRESCASTRRCRACAPRTVRSSCRRSISKSPRPRA